VGDKKREGREGKGRRQEQKGRRRKRKGECPLKQIPRSAHAVPRLYNTPPSIPVYIPETRQQI